MNTFIRLVSLLLLCYLFSCNPADKKSSQSRATEVPDPVTDCPVEGDAKSDRVRELNTLKNRWRMPASSDFDTLITLAEILEKGNDRNRWNVEKAVRITGYVFDVKIGGVETCNCKTKDRDVRDTHIELVLDPMNDSKLKRIIVEVTPRMRALMSKNGIDWRTSQIRDKYLGRWVSVEGWMLFDEEHENAAENTAAGRADNWRASAWEIHPVTKMEIVTKPRSE
jgi:hypothetical protein